MRTRPSQITTVISGYFNPLHVGHLDMIREAKALGERLVVIVNSDAQVTLKGSTPFMSEKERAEIVSAIQGVDEVVISIDTDRTVCKTLSQINPHIFANGGDRTNINEIPEAAICEEQEIQMAFNVGSRGKIQSSSWLIKKASERKKSKLSEQKNVQN
ncbi:MAG: adenylyltransferase/cytidyltransferase family protein [Candidatus Paceibacterota bacterium]